MAGGTDCKQVSAGERSSEPGRRALTAAATPRPAACTALRGAVRPRVGPGPGKPQRSCCGTRRARGGSGLVAQPWQTAASRWPPPRRCRPACAPPPPTHSARAAGGPAARHPLAAAGQRAPGPPLAAAPVGRGVEAIGIADHPQGARVCSAGRPFVAMNQPPHTSASRSAPPSGAGPPCWPRS